MIKTTPLPALDPYKDVEAASFKIVIDSISDGLIEEISPLKMAPSTTYKGALSAFTEPKPRIVTLAASTGCQIEEVICTPEVFPSNAERALLNGRLSIKAAPTVDAEPVKELFFAVP